MISLEGHTQVIVRQRKELVELIGFETRNKYELLSASGQVLGFAAEQNKGFLSFVLRQFLGHWRPFDILFFDTARTPVLRCYHPFRLFFQRLEIYSPSGSLMGSLQARWALFRKRFDVQGANGQVLLTMSSPFFRFWTFPFFRQGREVAVVRKKWSGILRETFLDADNFQIEFSDPALSNEHRHLILAAGLFVDLQYFEQKAD